MIIEGDYFPEIQCTKCNSLLYWVDKCNTEWENWKFCPGCPEFKKWYNKKIKTDFYKIIRFALTGSEDGMNVVDILMLLGREESLRRIKRCIDSYDKIHNM